LKQVGLAMEMYRQNPPQTYPDAHRIYSRSIFGQALTQRYPYTATIPFYDPGNNEYQNTNIGYPVFFGEKILDYVEKNTKSFVCPSDTNPGGARQFTSLYMKVIIGTDSTAATFPAGSDVATNVDAKYNIKYSYEYPSDKASFMSVPGTLNQTTAGFNSRSMPTINGRRMEQLMTDGRGTANIVLAFDMDDNHGSSGSGIGRNIVYADGHVANAITVAPGS